MKFMIKQFIRLYNDLFLITLYQFRCVINSQLFLQNIYSLFFIRRCVLYGEDQSIYQVISKANIHPYACCKCKKSDPQDFII